ncbi:hypothetical protein AMTRI_Chr11g154520 [Amborella trichopoda]
MSMAPSIELLTFFQLPKISPAFLNWKRQDQLLLSWIILTLIEGIHAQIVGLTTSQESDPITLNAPYGMLLSQEIRLSDQHYMLDIGSPSANLATTQNNSRRGRGSQFLNRGRGGHVPLQCRKQLNHAFQPDLGVNLNAFYAAHSNINDAWYPDSGASNHITADLSNLSLHSKYTGPAQINIGNGTGLSIKNIGSSKLITNSYICSSQYSTFNQFTKDNDIVFEFHPAYFVVKDRSTGRALLPTKDGLYQLEVAKKRNNKSTSSAFLGEKRNDIIDWAIQQYAQLGE